MKAFKTVMKILVALAAIAGVVYVIATYGDKLTAWAKKLLDKLGCCCCDCCCDCGEQIDEIAEEEVSEVDEKDFEG